MSAFSGLNTIYKWLSVLVYIIYVGILWLICSLPVVTIGPASTAMYYSMVKCVRRGRGHVSREFFSAFKSNFMPALKAWLIFLLPILLWFFSLLINQQSDPEGLRMISRLSRWLIVPLCFPLSWLFAYISRFDNSLGDTLKYSLFLSVKNFARTIIMLLTAAVFFFIGRLAPVAIPLLPGFCCLIASFQTEPVFKTISSQQENDANTDKWYNE